MRFKEVHFRVGCQFGLIELSGFLWLRRSLRLISIPQIPAAVAVPGTEHSEEKISIKGEPLNKTGC